MWRHSSRGERERERERCGEMMTMVMLGRLWCGGDDGSGYDIVGMVVMRCDEDGGGGMMKRGDDGGGVMVGCGGEAAGGGGGA
ncbi:hypothetical protein Tco_1046118 [Tanacetum coccineum]